MDHFFENYMALIEKVDAFVHDISTHYGSSIHCRKGCDSCCRHLSLFPVEAVRIRLALQALDEPMKDLIMEKASALIEDPDSACPLLHEGICLLYPVRPVICRTHGFPVLIETDGESRVDYCPLNFREGQTLENRHVLNLEQLNQTLSAINRVFTDQALEGADLPDRILLAEALLMGIDF